MKHILNDIEKFLELVEQKVQLKLVNKIVGDNGIVIFDYSRNCQFQKAYDEVTIACRGLVIDTINKKVLGMAPPKFFNVEELQVNEPQTYKKYFINKSVAVEVIQEKFDGSLGIIWWNPFINDWQITTRGSFKSEMAIKAKQMFESELYISKHFLDKSFTYAVEIIYPENRIVVDYGDMEALVLHSVMNNETFLPEQTKIFGGYGFKNCAHDLLDLKEIFKSNSSIYDIKKLNLKNKEGFIIKFEDGFWAKIKFEDYCNLHYVKSYINEKMLLENLVVNHGQYSEDLLKLIPDEFDDMARKVQKLVSDKFEEIKSEAIMLNDNLAYLSLKELGLKFAEKESPLFESPLKGIIFNLRRYELSEKTINSIYHLVKRELE